MPATWKIKPFSQSKFNMNNSGETKSNKLYWDFRKNRKYFGFSKGKETNLNDETFENPKLISNQMEIKKIETRKYF